MTDEVPYIHEFTDEEIEEFIQLYKQEFKEDITPAKARELATGVIGLLVLLCEKSPEKKEAGQERFEPAPKPQSRKGKRVRIPPDHPRSVTDIVKRKSP